MEKRNFGGALAARLTDPHCYALIYTVAMVLRSVYLLQVYADWVCKGCFVWGVCIVVYDAIFGKRNCLKAYKWYLFAAFIAVCGISVLLNVKYSFYDGVKNIVYCLLFFFVLYAQNGEISKEELFHRIKRYNDVFILLLALIATASLFTFVFHINFIHRVAGDIYRVGFWFNRLNGVWNGNTGTMLGLISVVMVAANCLIAKKTNIPKKILYVYNLIVQFVYACLAGSRAAVVCYVLVLVIALVFVVCPCLRMRKKLWQALVLTGLAGAVVLGASAALAYGTKAVMKEVPQVATQLFDKDNIPEQEIEFDRVENSDGANVDITNRRMQMWVAAWKIVKQHPIFGMADTTCLNPDGTPKGNIDGSMLTADDIQALKTAGFYFHNGYVQILLTVGFAGLILFFVIMISVGLKYFLFLLKGEQNGVGYKAVALIFALLAAVVVDNLAEVHFLFGGPDAVSTVFWYLAGAGLLLIKSETESQKNGETKSVD